MPRTGAALLAVLLIPAFAPAQNFERVSVTSLGFQATDVSEFRPSLSANGRYVAFTCLANLVAGDFNGVMDVYVHDRVTGITELISIGLGGLAGNGPSQRPAMSADGRYVAFESGASDLVLTDTNGFYDVFIHDRQTGIITLVSRSSGGAQGNGDSLFADLSDDGRVVSFDSDATNLVAGDSNQNRDVFARDLLLGKTVRASVSTSGVEGNSYSREAAISGDGKVIAFTSSASNLVAGDANHLDDIYLRDLQGRTTERITMGLLGIEPNDASALPALDFTGNTVAFESLAGNLVQNDTNGCADVFLHDRSTGLIERISKSSLGLQADHPSGGPSLSPDGDMVVFHSLSSLLDPVDLNGWWDVFVRYRSAGVTRLLSFNPVLGWGLWPHSYGPAISADGSSVAFVSESDSLVPFDTNGVRDAFVVDGFNGVGGGSPPQTMRMSEGTGGIQGNLDSLSGGVSADGRYGVFASDATNLAAGASSYRHVYLRDFTTGFTTLVTSGLGGVPANDRSDSPTISADGRYVALHSHATNLIAGTGIGGWHNYRYDRSTGLFEMVDVDSLGTPSDAHSDDPSISADGRYIAFESNGTNLVPGDTNGFLDVFVRDCEAGLTARVSVSSQGAEGNDDSRGGSISDDGRFVVFSSKASNLVPNDNNGLEDVFVHDLMTGLTERISDAANGGDAAGISTGGALSADGRFVAFTSSAANLVAGFTPTISPQAYVRDRVLGVTMPGSLNSQGLGADEISGSTDLSPNGRLLCFHSAALNLAAGASGFPWSDTYVRDLLAGTTEWISVNPNPGLREDAIGGSLTADGRFAAYDTFLPNIPQDSNGASDVYLRDRGSAATLDSGTIVMGADVLVQAGAPLRCSWFAAPPGSRWYLLGSMQNQGMVFHGHAFGLGPSFSILAQGAHGPRGAGTFQIPSVPQSLLGRLIYLEVAATAGGKIYDSNTVERLVQ